MTGRRTAAVLSTILAVGLALAGCAADSSAVPSSPTAGTGRDPVVADDPRVAPIESAVQTAIAEHGYAAVLLEIRDGDEVLLRQAWGESVPGTPATTRMHFRNGAIAITEMAVVLLQLVEEGRIGLDDRLSDWLPEIPSAGAVTIRQLAMMTSGYDDYERNPEFVDALMADPFQVWRTEQQLDWGVGLPLLFEPGTNWSYAHTNYVLLGLVIEAVTGDPLEDIIATRLLEPLGLTETAANDGAEMLAPALHAIDGERRTFLQVPAEVDFVEDSTGWNPGWSLAHGAIQNADIADTATLWQAIGRGELLQDESQSSLLSTATRDIAHPQAGCDLCRPMAESWTYAFGVALVDGWIVQNPSFHGYGGLAAYDPSRDLTVAIATTYTPGGFDEHGIAPNGAQTLFGLISPLL